jgi:trimeric autotransporter adhesin
VPRLLSFSLFVAVSATCLAQTPPSTTPAVAPAQPVQAGGTIHGTVKSGTTPLPGVSITAANTLTGKKYSTVTDATGAYSLAIPQNGRYVLKTDFAAFAATTKEALLNAASHDQQADFVLTLSSRATQQEGSDQTAQVTQTLRQYAGSGALNLSVLGGASDLIQAGSANSGSDAQLPSLANNSDFSGESVAVSGQSGTTNPFAGMDFNQMRQNMDDAQFQQSLSQTPGAGSRGGGQGGDSAFGGGGFGGGPGGGGGGGRGGFGGRGNFRNFKPNQPHGAFFWNGGNSALNAEPFSIRGAALNQPAYQSNHFGLTFVGAPYIPKILTNDKKDFLFFTLAGNYTSSPFNQYGTVPTAAERTGNLSALTTQSGAPITIYNPPASSTPGGATCTANGNVPGQPFVGNIIPALCISPQSTGLLNYIPQQNLPGAFQNYQRISTAQTNTTNVGVRFIHNFGSSAGGSPMIGMIRQVMGQGTNTWRQTVNFNFNYSHNAADELNIFPDLGGKQQTHQYSVQAGYTLGKNKLTNNLTAGWNRSDTQLLNYFTNTTDVASQLGINVFNGAASPLNFGLPSLTLTQFSGLNEQQPNLHVNQTISVSESSSWIHHKNNFKFGGDFRRVHLDMIGQANSTGSFTFTGLFTSQPGSVATASGVSATGSDLADLLLGFPQQTALQAPYQKAYLRENVWDLFGQDTWQALKNFTVTAGLRYEYFSPYSEKDDRLVNLDAGNDFTTVVPVQPNQVGPFSGKYPRTLIEPERNDFSPRIGIAWRAIKDTVVRAGYGINFANGQYARFVQDFAFQPPFADVQTNESTTGADITLANGFLPSPPATGNYAVNKNYRLPYVQVWNLDIQRTLPLGIVLNVGYNGSKGTRLDVVSAPGRTATESLGGYYDWEDSIAFSNFNALAVRLRKRMQRGIAVGATYTYSHSIDNASSVGGVGGVVAQNWQNILAEESNSSFDIRQQIKGDFVYELPFGPDTHMLTTGNWISHALANISMSGNFDFATGEPLTPHYQANIADVARGSTGSLRPDRVPGASITTGGGTIRNWFNQAAFTQPAATYGSATRYSIPGPGTVSFNASLSKSVRFGDMRSLEVRATSNNVFNTVQYAGVDTTVGSATYGQVNSAAQMRQFTFLARYRF